jgi:hypothetical protein
MLKRKRTMDIDVAVRVLQQFVRKRVLRLTNREDLVDLEPFNVKQLPLFEHHVDANHTYRFIPRQLVHHFVKSGSFCNPYTQVEFLPVELLRLTRLIKLNDPQFPWNFGSAKDRDTVRRQAIEKQQIEQTTEALRLSLLDVTSRQQSIPSTNPHQPLEWWLSLASHHTPERDESLTNLIRFAPHVAQQTIDEVMAQWCGYEGNDTISPPVRTFMMFITQDLQQAYSELSRLRQSVPLEVAFMNFMQQMGMLSSVLQHAAAVQDLVGGDDDEDDGDNDEEEEE